MIFTLLLLNYQPIFAAEQFTLDADHSYVLWQINHLGFSTQTGKWHANGTLTLDKEKPSNSKVNVVIRINNIITGIPELDKHLKEKSFFDAVHFPNATFVSNKIDLIGNNNAKVYGLLTIRGISKPVTLNVKLNQAAISPITKKMTVGFSATTKIKRSDFGMTAYLPKLGDEVKLTIEAEAVKTNK